MDMTGLLPESDCLFKENNEEQDCAGVDEEKKDRGEEEEFDEMPNALVMEDDYFQTDEQDKAKAQIQTLTEKTQKVAQNLPLHTCISK